MKWFNLDSPLMQGLSRMADILWLNVLTLIFCLPVVTAGASLTAMHYMSLKMARNEESYISAGFFKAFKQNFKQATAIWFIELAALLVIVGDFYIMVASENGIHIAIQVVIYIVTFLFLMTVTFVYPLLAKFENTVRQTIKNAFLISIMQFPKTVLKIIMSAIPIAAFILFPQAIPLVLMFGLALPAYLFAKLYDKFFARYEEMVLAQNGGGETEEGEGEEEEDERIFKDELDPALAAMRDDEE